MHQQVGHEPPQRTASNPTAIWWWHLLARLWYPVLTRFTKNSSLTFLNYGYSSDQSSAVIPKLLEQDEPDRSCIQLYDHVAEGVDLSGLDVLEVSCGHGGGASYLARYRKPKTVHGVDRNPQAIKLCNQRHNSPGLSFSCRDAMALNFDDGSFDAIVNVEASHCYADLPHFLRQIAKLLRPGGYFLYADFRHNGPDYALLQQQVEQSGLELVQKENISPDVVRGMELNTDKYKELIASLVPKRLRRPAMSFAGLKGSPVYKALDCGDTVYFRYLLRKRGAPAE